MTDDRPHLARIGLAPPRVEAVAASLARCDAALDAMGAGGDRHAAWIPGRVELLGKHVDYAGGRSLLCAVDRGFAVRVATRTDATVRAVDVTTGEACTVPLDGTASAPPGTWANYVATVARRMARNFPELARGVDFAFASDLPVAAGMSSSSALMIAVSVALAKSNQLGASETFRTAIATREELASYLGSIENGSSFRMLAGDAGVGTFGGSQDHVAILCAEPGRVLQFSFAPVRREASYDMPPGHVLAIAASGVTAEKSAGARDAYNRAATLVAELLARWCADTARADASLADAARSDAGAPDRLRALADALSPAHRDRLEQFLLESFELVPGAARALAQGDVAALGAIADRSQDAAERWLCNQVPETVALARLARAHGAPAASAFGAGFGGSVWALVAEPAAADFVRAWHDAYAAEFPDAAARAAFFVTPAAGGAQQW